ncbi:MOSC domain-containing protein [Hydrogenophaga sp.]|jgi:uncharacterized protein YcbX|uniref:MOSC domain-containing protein n=1 Tax=Hydrogenophaga sp. TaxID=1904254 RepID=UPI003F70FDF7
MAALKLDDADMSHIASLYRYPVKGLSPESLDAVTLAAGSGFPCDRRMAIANGRWTFEADRYVARPKLDFLALMNHPRLALLKTRFDDLTRILHVQVPGADAQTVDIDSFESRAEFGRFLRDYLALPGDEMPALVDARECAFTEIAVVGDELKTMVSLINLQTVRRLGEQLGTDIDPLRFRANCYVDGIEPWEEMRWLGQTITIGGVQARCTLRTRRCAVPSVDPTTGERNLGVIQSLVKFYGHQDLGIYLTVESGGMLKVGDSLQAPSINAPRSAFRTMRWNGIDFEVFRDVSPRSAA